MISLVQMPVRRCYTGNTVRLEGYGYGDCDVKPSIGIVPLFYCLHCGFG